MKCHKCNSPLKIIRGGHKTVADSTDITMVHVFGCMNSNCTMAMLEQSRSESIVESFTEPEPEVPKVPEVDVNINITSDGPIVDSPPEEIIEDKSK